VITRAGHLPVVDRSLVTYIDAVHLLVHVYDGFLVHSRMGGAPIRDDVGVPVLVFQTESDVSFSRGSGRQPDTDMYRLWEVAGTAHFAVGSRPLLGCSHERTKQ